MYQALSPTHHHTLTPPPRPALSAPPALLPFFHRPHGVAVTAVGAAFGEGHIVSAEDPRKAGMSRAQRAGPDTERGTGAAEAHFCAGGREKQSFLVDGTGYLTAGDAVTGGPLPRAVCPEFILIGLGGHTPAVTKFHCSHIILRLKFQDVVHSAPILAYAVLGHSVVSALAPVVVLIIVQIVILWIQLSPGKVSAVFFFGR